MKNDKKNGSFLGVVPLILFLIIYLSTGIISGDFGSMPLLVGIIIASAIALSLNNKHNKRNFSEKIEIFCTGGGESTLIMMVVIFILAGAFGGVAKQMGAVDSVTSLGLSLLPARMVLPGLFIIGCILSFAMGTSMGTVAALMPIGIDIAEKTNVNVLLICGIVVGGAMFGDNLSFISDTVIAAVRTQKVEMKSKFIYNSLILLPAVILNIIFLGITPINTNLLSGETYSYSLINLLPYIIVIVTSLIGINVMLVMTLGVVSGMILGIANGSFGFLESFTVAHQGMMGMEDMAIIAVFVGGLVALMTELGGIDWVLSKLSKATKTSTGGEVSIAALTMILGAATTNNTIAVVATGPIAKDIGQKFKIPRVRVATLLSLFCCCTQGLLPHAGQLLVASGLAAVSPVRIIPYVWYCLLMTVCGFAAILLKLPRLKYTEESGYDHFDDNYIDAVEELVGEEIVNHE